MARRHNVAELKSWADQFAQFMAEVNFEAAEAVMQQIHQALPENPDILFALADVKARQYHYQDALTLLEQINDLEHHPVWGLRYADILYRKGDSANAMLIIESLAQRFPDNVEVMSYFGARLKDAGHVERAKTVLFSALDLDSTHTKTWHSISSFIDFSKNSNALNALLACELSAKNATVISQDQALLFFTLGKAHLDLRQYEKAFCYYQSANAYMTKVQPVRRRTESSYHYLKSFYSTHKLNVASSQDKASNILILGLSRSGKSLVESLLSKHPRVQGLGESKDLAGFYQSLAASTKRSIPDYLTGLTESQRLELTQKYREMFDRQGVYTAQTLPSNITMLDLVGTLSPSTPIIFVTRDLNDHGLACYFSFYSEGNEFSYDLYETGREVYFYQALMTLWQNILPNPILNIRYEELVKYPQRVSLRLFEFLKLDWRAEYFHGLQSERAYSEHIAPYQSLDISSPIRQDFIGWSQLFENKLTTLRDGFQDAHLGRSVVKNKPKKQQFNELITQYKKQLKVHQYHGALSTAKQLLKHQPAHPQCLRMAGMAASLVGQDQAALNFLTQAQAQQPQDIGLLTNLARAQIRAQKFKLADKSLAKIKLDAPNHPARYDTELALIWANPPSAPKRLRQALELADEALQHQPDQALLHHYQAWLMHRLGEHSSAQAHYQRLFEALEQGRMTLDAPDLCQVHQGYSQVLEALKQTPQAIEHSWQACLQRPYSRNTVKAYAQLQAQLLRSPDAQHQALGQLHQRISRIWAGYKDDQLQYSFGDFGLPYQSFEPLMLAGTRPAMQRLEHYQLERFLPPQARALDIGCNHGFLLMGVAESLSYGQGFDISNACIEVGQAVAQHLGHSHIHLSAQTFENFMAEQNTQQSEGFDLVIACAVHRWIGVPLEEFGQILHGLCRKGGYVLLESQGTRQTDATEAHFAEQMDKIQNQGFKLAHQGSLCDDQLNYREFQLLQKQN
ncbi:MAG: sulfotransferase [Thiomicrospira sp.]